MRTNIKLALPAMAAVAALALTACNDDDDNESPAAQGAGQSQTEASSEPSGDAQSGGPAPSLSDLEGTWMTGADSDASMLIVGEDGSVNWVENEGDEGDVCMGSVDGATMTVECMQYGDQAWPDTEATLSLADGTLTVAWASGTTQTFTSLADMGLGDLDDLIGDLGDLE